MDSLIEAIANNLTAVLAIGYVAGFLVASLIMAVRAAVRLFINIAHKG